MRSVITQTFGISPEAAKKAVPLAEQADIAIRAPGNDTPEIQGWHIQLYHVLCDMLEAAAFGD